jgi:membrane protease subunit HflK
VNDKTLKRTINSLKLVVLALVVALLAWLSVYSIGEQEQAVIVTFGEPVTVSEPGLHFKIPFIQQMHIVPMTINGLSIGYDSATGESNEAESLMITSDYNFVNVDFYLEYRVSDPIKYIFASRQPESILRMMALSYIRDTVGLYPVDSVITTCKNEIQLEIEEKLSNRLALEDVGLQVHNLTIQDAEPPTAEVFEAFKAVENAMQGRETAINNANKYRSEQEPSALARVDAVMKEAEAQKEARINEAKGQVARFDAMYNEYTRYPLITRQRMYYEAMEQILPELKVVINNSSEDTSMMLPLAPFSESNNAGGAAQ